VVKGAAAVGPTGVAGWAGAAAASGVPHAWQNLLLSGFWVPHRAQTSAI
jgi:hypothetical protein